MFRNHAFLTVACFLLLSYTFPQGKSNKAFRIVPLGVKGGIDESNLSAYMVAAKGTTNYICLDAGTLHYGIEKAISNKVFPAPPERVIKEYIKGYLISHAHLDHVAGLIINSTDDTTKDIYASASCIETLKTRYFTWEAWVNFADEGESPLLKKYHYEVIGYDSNIIIKNTGMELKAFSLSHSNLQSTAFLINNKDAYILYLGDTGDDETENSHNLLELWNGIGDLVKAKKIKAIFIEVSYTNEQPVKQLFGHLTPALLIKEMNVLQGLSGEGVLKGLPVVITHLKLFEKKEIEKLKTQLNKANNLGVKFIFAEQAKPLMF